MKKKKGQAIHAFKRNLARNGCALPPAVQNKIARKIRNQQGTFVKKCTNRITIWIVDGKKVAYDKTRGAIATVLSPPKNED